VYFTVTAHGVVTGAVEEDPALGAPGPGGSDEAARLVARVDPKSKITEGSKIELAVDTSRLYFFDPESRAAV
jgi:multiple sugar transport system ATP-binding protein